MGSQASDPGDLGFRYFAEVLANKALFSSIGAQDNQAGSQQLTEEAMKVMHWFTTV